MESFDEMLNHFYDEINVNKSKSINLDPPILQNYVWKNAKQFLRKIQRDPTHFINFLARKTDGNASWKTSSKSDGIKFLNKTNKDTVQKYMIEYMKNYVQCNQCQSCQTFLVKDQSLNKFKICCNICKAFRYC